MVMCNHREVTVALCEMLVISFGVNRHSLIFQSCIVEDHC